MEAINRKQVPLCRDHHTRLHTNKWTEEERLDYPNQMHRYSKRAQSLARGVKDEDLKGLLINE